MKPRLLRKLPFYNYRISSKIQLEAGGKPSTWFPPGRLVEHIFLMSPTSLNDPKRKNGTLNPSRLMAKSPGPINIWGHSEFPAMSV